MKCLVFSRQVLLRRRLVQNAAVVSRGSQCREHVFTFSGRGSNRKSRRRISTEKDLLIT